MAEDEQSQNSIWKHPLFVGLLTAIIGTIVGGIVVFYWTQKEPVLTYEVFPVTLFTSEERALAIQNVRIENSGNMEVEDVQFQVTLPDGAEAVEASVDLSSTAIDYEVVNATLSGQISYTFPLLNPGESARFSFLVSGASGGVATISLRGHGLTGQERETESGSNPWPIVAVGLIAFFASLIVMRRVWKEAEVSLLEMSERIQELMTLTDELAEEFIHLRESTAQQETKQPSQKPDDAPEATQEVISSHHQTTEQDDPEEETP